MYPQELCTELCMGFVKIEAMPDRARLISVLARFSMTRIGASTSSDFLLCVRSYSISCYLVLRQKRLFVSYNMARGIEGNEMATPRPKPSLPSQSSSSKQRTITGFFQKKAAPASSPAIQTPKAVPVPIPTPSSSMEHTQPSSPPTVQSSVTTGGNKENGLPSPVTSNFDQEADSASKEGPDTLLSSPSRRVRLCSALTVFLD